MDARPAPTVAVPVTIVGGFLGAGKTTLLNHLLSHEDGRRLGVIVNDFGSINIDAALVVGVEGDMVQLSNGCICCTIQDDLVEALDRLLSVPEPPQHIIIEASGVSDPRSVAATLEQRVNPALATIDAVIVVVDVEQHLSMSRRERIVAGGQLRAADILVLNKIDLVEEAALDALETRLRPRLKRGRIFRAVRGRVPAALVLGVGVFDAARSCGPEAMHVHLHELPNGGPADEEGAEAGHDDGGHDHSAHEHGGHDHGAEFWTWSFRTPRPLSARRLRRAVDALPPAVVRAKGTIQLSSHAGRRAVMHVVGRRAELCLGEPWGEAEPETQLVVIGVDEPLAADALEQMFRACEVEPGTGGPAKTMWRWVRRVLPSGTG